MGELQRHGRLSLPRAAGVVGQIIPWNFPMLMAVWKLARTRCRQSVVIKPAEHACDDHTWADDRPHPARGRFRNIVNGFGLEAGKPLASSNRRRQDRLHRRDDTGRLIAQMHASKFDHPGDVGAGRQSPNIFFSDVMREDDAYSTERLEGFTMFALNQGEVCTCPSTRTDPARHLRGLHGTRPRAGERHHLR